MIKSIEQETTSLGELGLTIDQIMAGEHVEFEPEKKVNTRKLDYVQHGLAEKAVNAYAADLLAAYRIIEDLEGQLEANGVELEDVSVAAKKAAEQVRQVIKADSEFKEAEKLLSKFEQQLDLLAKDKQVDQETISKLKAQVNELIELRETVPQLESDVNAVLENLRSYFVEEGIDIDDEEEYDEEDDYEDGYEA